MRLATIHFLVGPALGAELAFNLADEPEKQAALFSAGMLARGTSQAAFRQLAVPCRNGWRTHLESPFRNRGILPRTANARPALFPLHRLNPAEPFLGLRGQLSDVFIGQELVLA